MPMEPFGMPGRKLDILEAVPACFNTAMQK